MTKSNIPILDDDAIAEIEALSAKVPDGPWFVDKDDAEDVPDHRRSGLALVDTGRSADWWIARLCEWHVARFIAESKTNVDALCQTVRALRAENERLATVSGEWAGLLDRIRAWSKCADGYPLDEHINNIAVDRERLQSQLEQLTKERDSMRSACVEKVKAKAAKYQGLADNSLPNDQTAARLAAAAAALNSVAEELKSVSIVEQEAKQS